MHFQTKHLHKKNKYLVTANVYITLLAEQCPGFLPRILFGALLCLYRIIFLVNIRSYTFIYISKTLTFFYKYHDLV